MTLATNPPIEIPLERMSFAHKLALKEALDQDLETACRTEEACTPQDWHFEVLAERERRLASGETKLISLEQFARELREELP